MNTNEKLVTILIIVLATGFILLLGKELGFWCTSEHLEYVPEKIMLDSDTISSQPLAPVELDALKLTELCL